MTMTKNAAVQDEEDNGAKAQPIFTFIFTERKLYPRQVEFLLKQLKATAQDEDDESGN